MLKKFFQYLKDNHYEIVFSTVKSEEYSGMKYKLISNGIKVKTKIISHNDVGTLVTINNHGNEFYEIYVLDNDIQKANKIIHS